MAQASMRRLDLDRLRTLACLSTFAYHAIQVFDLNPYYHLKSSTPSPALDVAARLLHAVRMPTFFLIAGMVGCLALARYGNRQLLRQRAARLLPPFLVGIILLTPVVKYFEILDGRSISWQGITLLAGPPPDLLTILRRYYTQQRWFSWSHMWFPLYLFLLGTLLLPLMRAMLRADDRSRLAVAAALAGPLVAMAAVELVLRPIYPWHLPNLIADWASVANYTICMLAGAAFVRWPLIETLLQRGIALSAALAALGAVLYLGSGDWPWRNLGRACWLWGVLCTAIGARPLLERGRIPGEAYLAEGALAIYVLHHVPLIMIAYAVKDLPWTVAARYLTIVLGALAATLAAYHLLVRPFDAVRLAFGMARRRPAEPSTFAGAKA